jgi:7-cyano-7-deazaguanine synthase
VVLVSGGLDSATCLAIARGEGYDCYSLNFAYGQRHAVELAAARRVAEALGAVEHRVMHIDLAAFGGSALTDSRIPVPEASTGALPGQPASLSGVPASSASSASSAMMDGDTGRARVTNDIPVTYVPARNTVFLSLALAWAEVLGARDIFIGVNAVDYSGYPDCRPAFVEAFERLANVATRAGVEGTHLRVRVPLIALTKADIIRLGQALGVDYSLTVSCYQADDDGRGCGRCDACRLRREGFAAAGVPDPTRYR